VHRYNADGVEGLKSRQSPGRAPALTEQKKAQLRELVLKGPDPLVNNVVRWRCVDLNPDISRDVFGCGFLLSIFGGVGQGRAGPMRERRVERLAVIACFLWAWGLAAVVTRRCGACQAGDPRARQSWAAARRHSWA
jgi:hypothetical protein